MVKKRVYLCIDFKSFYASVECVERGLDPLSALLVVADPERGRGTICLAVSCALKGLGVKNRCRIFQIPSHIPYVTAVPRMKLYIDYSAEIYGLYLKYIAKEDIHVYSVDEAFLDITDYLSLYQASPEDLARQIMQDILRHTGIPSAAGIGTNLYLAKTALDLLAKHSPENLASLDEESYQKSLWRHRPLSDFWRIGKSMEARLNQIGLFTMEDIAKSQEAPLYHAFGRDAELLIDHAFGREPVTIAHIKNYLPKSRSLSSSQMLPRNYTYEEGMLILKEMVDSLCLELAAQGLCAGSLSLTVDYSWHWGPKPSTAAVPLPVSANSYRCILPHALRCYERITDKNAPIRKLSLSFGSVSRETFRQYELFTSPREQDRDRRLQQAVWDIRRRFGPNALLRGMDLMEAATTRERNLQIGGHKSGQ